MAGRADPGWPFYAGEIFFGWAGWRGVTGPTKISLKSPSGGVGRNCWLRIRSAVSWQPKTGEPRIYGTYPQYICNFGPWWADPGGPWLYMRFTLIKIDKKWRFAGKTARFPQRKVVKKGHSHNVLL